MRLFSFLLAGALGHAAAASAITVGGIDFAASAFPDTIFVIDAGPADFQNAAGDLITPEAALLGSDLDSFFTGEFGSSLFAVFDDNRAINGEGDDLAFFDVSDEPGALIVLVNVAEFFFVTFESTGLFTPAGMPINVGFFDLADAGLADGEAIDAVALIAGFNPTRIAAVGALNTVAVPAPPALALFGLGLAAIARWRALALST